MSVLIVGHCGNMGKRYGKIFDHLGVSWNGIDSVNRYYDEEKLISQAQAILIATPTDTHCAVIKQYLKYGKPILCEKPISTNLNELNDTLTEVKQTSVPLTMVMNYAELVDPHSSGLTSYNYFKHGNDGIAWDCIQLIALADQNIELRDDSPIWQCRINGHKLNLNQIDLSYIKFVQRWLKYPNIQSLQTIRAAHEKVVRYRQGEFD